MRFPYASSAVTHAKGTAASIARCSIHLKCSFPLDEA